MLSLDSPTTFDAAAVDFGVMDCIVANVAALTSLHGGEARRALGSQWCFTFGADAGGPELRLDRMTLADQLRQMGGMRLSSHRLGGSPADEIKALVTRHGPLVVYGDAHGMPWTPLHGHEHVEHTFLVRAVNDDGTLTVFDAYTNKTEHGEATPTAAIVDCATAVAAIDGLDSPERRVALSLAPLEEAPPPSHEVIADNCRVLLGEDDAMTAFVAYYEGAGPEAAKEFALGCWLTARKRALHERWLGDVAQRCGRVPATLVATFGERIAGPWQRVSEFAYLAERRVRSGRQAPSAAFRMIEELHAAECEVASALLMAVEAAP